MQDTGTDTDTDIGTDIGTDTSTDTVSVLVSHRGVERRLPVGPATTVGELRARIALAFGVAAGDQKLLCRGALADDRAAVRAAVPPGARVVVVGTPAPELAAHQTSAARRAAGRANRERLRATAADVRRTAQPADDEYGFGALAPLELPRRDAALHALRRLARDAGVRAVMRRHRFAVGELRELHPAERTILGYNRNRGQVIALRLRTDDLAGFRDYDAVRQVLMHELAHMVWDAHDDSFHALNRQLCREVVALDWTRSGRSVGPAVARAPTPTPPPPSDAALVDGGALGPGGFVLGGAAPPPDASDRRERAYQAWVRRTGNK
ncbi:hypothetical protein H4R18_005227 [Coemansia javaensis]|uniref:WLM domain-containing protein n=1 Tax=Coemansia javaensis TaxID=2761396 RepID=A0A9W8H8E7_9FUNG|nr:hypothetical protein H4R18_005227 [Coemansia javaensis]